MVTPVFRNKDFSVSASPQVDQAVMLGHSVTCIWGQARNVVKASDYCLVGIWVFFTIALQWFLSSCSCEMVT